MKYGIFVTFFVLWRKPESIVQYYNCPEIYASTRYSFIRSSAIRLAQKRHHAGKELFPGLVTKFTISHVFPSLMCLYFPNSTVVYFLTYVLSNYCNRKQIYVEF